MGSIELEDINKVYPDGYHAIRDLNLQVQDGEFVILVGPSGCGKSTALRMVAGLEDITSGKMTIGDQVVNDKTPKERNIAMVFQSYALYPHMTVAENMGFALKLAKEDQSEIDRKVKEAAETLDLSEYLHRKPKALSGGQRQRVAMGRAIVRSPEAFLMDEPLSNLDAKLRVAMRAEISELQNRLGVTTLYVTHDQVEAMTMGDRVAVLKRGELQQVAPPQDLYEHPDNLFVAGFIGSPAMNIQVGRISREGDDLHVSMGDHDVVIGDRAKQEYPAVADHVGDEVAVGIRPEHFLRGDDVSDGNSLGELEVALVEMLGSEMLVHLRSSAKPVVSEDMRAAVDDDEAFEKLQAEAEAGGTSLVARFEPFRAPSVGDRLRVGVKADRLHFFDLRSGSALR